MVHKGFLVERYYDHNGNSGWTGHKFTDSLGPAKASITQAKKHYYRNNVFRIVRLWSDEESINPNQRTSDKTK